MAGKARMRFVARSNRLRFERDSGHYAGANLYGVDCIYCHEYFPECKEARVWRSCMQELQMSFIYRNWMVHNLVDTH